MSEETTTHYGFPLATVISYDDCARIYAENGWRGNCKSYGEIASEVVGSALVEVRLAERDDGGKAVKIITHRRDDILNAVIRLNITLSFDALDAIVRMRDRLVSEQTNTDDKENRR